MPPLPVCEGTGPVAQLTPTVAVLSAVRTCPLDPTGNLCKVAVVRANRSPFVVKVDAGIAALAVVTPSLKNTKSALVSTCLTVAPLACATALVPACALCIVNTSPELATT